MVAQSVALFNKGFISSKEVAAAQIAIGMGKAKKIGMGIGIAFGIVIVLGIIGASMSQNRDDNAIENGQSNTVGSDNPTITPTNSEPITDVTNAALEDILPMRDDIGTAWTMEPPNNNASTFDSFGGIFSYEVTNSEVAVRQRFIKTDPTQDFKVTLYRFSSSSQATDFHRDLVADLSEKGGYEEHEVSDINAECYATTYREGNLDFYCVKKNVFYHVNALAGVLSGDVDQLRHDANHFAAIIANKI